MIDELAEHLAKVSEEVVDTGKPGSVTLTLKVSNKGIGDVFVMVEETIARSAPKREPKGTFFYAVEGGLHRQDPRQASMEFREVDRSTGEIRERRPDSTTREASS